MDQKLVIPLFVVFLLIGAIGGYSMKADNIIEVEVPVEVVKNVTVVETVEVEVEVPGISGYIETAVIDFVDYLDDEDNLTCDSNDYDFNEVSVYRDWDNYGYSVAINDDDDVTIDFTVRLKFDEDGERSCKETYNVEALYEEDEDTIFNF